MVGFVSVCDHCNLAGKEAKERRLAWEVLVDVLVENLLGQSRQHVARLNDVDSDVRVGPFDCEGAAEVADCGFGGVVGGLGLRDVDDCAGHAADEDDAAGALALHEVACDSGGEEVGSVDVDWDLVLVFVFVHMRSCEILFFLGVFCVPPQSFLMRSYG